LHVYFMHVCVDFFSLLKASQWVENEEQQSKRYSNTSQFHINISIVVYFVDWFVMIGVNLVLYMTTYLWRCMYVWVFLTIEGFTMSAKWRTAIKVLFQYITINGMIQTLIRLFI
jgi:hypothetical protein